MHQSPSIKPESPVGSYEHAVVCHYADCGCFLTRCSLLCEQDDAIADPVADSMICPLALMLSQPACKEQRGVHRVDAA